MPGDISTNHAHGTLASHSLQAKVYTAHPRLCPYTQYSMPCRWASICAGHPGSFPPHASLPLQVGFTLHSVTMFGMAKKKPVFIAGGGTPARLEMWELQGKKPAQRLILPDAATDRNSFVSSVACIEYQVVACSGTKVYQYNVRWAGQGLLVRAFADVSSVACTQCQVALGLGTNVLPRN